MVAGLAVMDAVGAAGGGGGGGGGAGGAFFLQAPSVRMLASASASIIHFQLRDFTSSSMASSSPNHGTGMNAHLCSRTSVINLFARADYLKLQFGCEFFPEKVNCFCLLPSASIVHICSLPLALD